MSTLFTVIVELLLQSEKPFVLRMSPPSTPDTSASTVRLDFCNFHILKKIFNSTAVQASRWRRVLLYYPVLFIWGIDMLG